MSKLNLMNRHLFGVGTSICERLEPYSSEYQLLFNELRKSYLFNTGSVYRLFNIR